MNDLPDPLVLVGGPLPIQCLVKRYAALKGWQRLLIIDYESPGENRTSRSRKTLQLILEASKPGDKIVIFLLPAHLYQGWLKPLEAAGRLTEIPLYNLSIARQMATLQRWITALESRPRPPSRLTRFLNKVKESPLFLKGHLRRIPPARQQNSSRTAKGNL